MAICLSRASARIRGVVRLTPRPEEWPRFGSKSPEGLRRRHLRPGDGGDSSAMEAAPRTVDSGVTSQFQADAIKLFCLDSQNSLAGWRTGPNCFALYGVSSTRPSRQDPEAGQQRVCFG